jgi:hypothetical protein
MAIAVIQTQRPTPMLRIDAACCVLAGAVVGRSGESGAS